MDMKHKPRHISTYGIVSIIKNQRDCRTKITYHAMKINSHKNVKRVESTESERTNQENTYYVRGYAHASTRGAAARQRHERLRLSPMIPPPRSLHHRSPLHQSISTCIFPHTQPSISYRERQHAAFFPHDPCKPAPPVGGTYLDEAEERIELTPDVGSGARTGMGLIYLNLSGIRTCEGIQQECNNVHKKSGVVQHVGCSKKRAGKGYSCYLN